MLNYCILLIDIHLTELKHVIFDIMSKYHI